MAKPVLTPTNFFNPVSQVKKRPVLVQKSIVPLLAQKNKNPVCPPSPLPPFHQIPCPSIVSYNPTSLSSYSDLSTKVHKKILKLSRNHEIVCLQETKLLANDFSSLKSVLSSHTLFYSNNPENTGAKASTYTAGVCTAVTRSITSQFVTSSIDLHVSLAGHALVIRFELPGSDFSLNLVNIRLVTPPSGKVEAQEVQIKHLLDSLNKHPAKFTIMTGDFNFVEREQDSTSNFPCAPRPMWDSLLDTLSLKDQTSDVHTFFHRPTDSHCPSWSSRLDRFYISHSEADLLVVKPVASSDTSPLVDAGSIGFNAHVPTSLRFFSRVKSKKGPRRLDDLTVADPSFKKLTLSHWTKLKKKYPLANPVKKLALLGDAMHKASSDIFFRKKSEVNTVILLQKAFSLYRTLSSHNPSLKDVARCVRGTDLMSMVTFQDSFWDTSKLKSFIDSAFRMTGSPETGVDGGDEEHRVALVTLPGQDKIPRSNGLSELKLTLPSTRTKIEALKAGPDRIPSSDPLVIGPVIQEHYSNVWKLVPPGPDRNNEVSEYLSDYKRRVSDDSILELSLELVLRAIHMAPRTSPGPDGIPFSAFKVLSEVAGPAILEVCLFLSTTRDPEQLGDFNHATLFLLPKKETLEVEDTRPISVNNTGNRIVARTLFLAVVDASQDLVGKYQKMFLPGRKMTDHLRSLNDSYYSKVQADLDHFILFTDNRKAFDSIHHDFILATLTRQGFPVWFVNSVSNLLIGVLVAPSIAKGHPIRIERGVKQGCPLSPLLFILCYDVLASKLDVFDDVQVKAAADDLAIEAGCIEDIILTFPVLDLFTTASGLGINRDKTVILSARDSPTIPPDIVQIKLMGSSWPLVKIVPSHKYLGILFGRNIKVDDIYKVAFVKTMERARRFTSATKFMSTQMKILVFNVFVTPVLSFIQQFFIMSSWMYRAYRGLVHRMITPFNRSAWPYSQLCAPFHSVGFRQPLRDPWVSNMYAILKEVNFASFSSETDLPWSLDRSRSVRQPNLPCDWESPVFRDHTDLTVMEFLGSDCMDWDGDHPLPKLDGVTIKKVLVQKLIVSYNESCKKRYTNELGRDHLTHLSLKFANWNGSSNTTLEHFGSLPPSTPGFLVTLFVKILCNALNTDGDRRRHFDPLGSRHQLKSVTNLTPCYLCNQGNNTKGETGDSCKHIFQNCQVIKKALVLTLSHCEGPNDPEMRGYFSSKTNPLFVLDYPPAGSSLGYSRLSFVMCFCWAVYKTIEQVRMGRDNEGAAERVLLLTLSLKNLWKTRVKKPSKYGTSQHRSDSQSSVSLTDSMGLIRSLPEHCFVVSVSGSSKGLLGPVGVGAVVTLNRPDCDTVNFHLVQTLDSPCPVVGVFWAINMALSCITSNPTLHPASRLYPVFILTDNVRVTTTLRKGFCKDKSLECLLRLTKQLFNAFGFSLPRLFWIPGHSSILDLASAKVLAVRGRDQVSSPVFRFHPRLPLTHCDYREVDLEPLGPPL